MTDEHLNHPEPGWNFDTKTRASAAARDLPPPEVVRLEPLPGDRRTPLVAAHVQLGPVGLVYLVAGLRRGRMEVRPPVDPADGQDAVALPEPVAEAVEAAIIAAVKALPEARRHLARR
jgi:hypothetical protein